MRGRIMRFTQVPGRKRETMVNVEEMMQTRRKCNLCGISEASTNNGKPKEREYRPHPLNASQASNWAI